MADVIYNTYLTELREYLKSSKDDDDNVLNMLERGHHAVMEHCGVFELSDFFGKDLVFNWVRFEFNGYREHFLSSFDTEVNTLRMRLWMDGESDAEKT